MPGIGGPDVSGPQAPVLTDEPGEEVSGPEVKGKARAAVRRRASGIRLRRGTWPLAAPARGRGQGAGMSEATLNTEHATGSITPSSHTGTDAAQTLRRVQARDLVSLAGEARALPSGSEPSTPTEPDAESEPATPSGLGSSAASSSGMPADDAEDLLGDQWWTEDSGPRTRVGELYRPTAAQRRYLNQNRLQIRWVAADGDCNFTATTYVVPQPELRDRIRAAAQRWGIEVPSGEPDDVGWLLRRAAGQGSPTCRRWGPMIW